MKTCTKCNIEMDLDRFSKDKTKIDGLRPSCKGCKKLSDKKYYNENIEKITRNGKLYSSRTIVQRSEYKKTYYIENKVDLNLKSREYYYKNIDTRRKYNNEQSVLNKESNCLYKKTYRSENKGIINASNAKRRAEKLNASICLTKEHCQQIKEIYIKAQQLCEETNIKYHVDHIVPLRGKTVCGLHVPWNLQILTAEENLKKHAKLLEEAI